MGVTDPVLSRVNSLGRNLAHDRKEDEFVRNYILDRSETYQLNPVERAICRTWVRDEISNVVSPMIGASMVALVMRSRSVNLSRALMFGGLAWGIYVGAKGGSTRPAIEFPGNNPLFVECINACQKKFPQGQVVTRTKWIHDTLFMNKTLVEYPVNQPVKVSDVDAVGQMQAYFKTAHSTFKIPHDNFWIKLFGSSMFRQIESHNATADRITLLKTMEKMKSGTYDKQAFSAQPVDSSLTVEKQLTNAIKPPAPIQQTILVQSPPEVTEELEEHDIPVSQWPDLHPGVNIEALERLAAARRQAERERRALKRARELLPDLGKAELAQ